MNTDNIKSHIINTTICLVSAMTLCLTAGYYFSSNDKNITYTSESINRQYCENVPLTGITNGCNQCFASSGIQMLFSCPEFCQYLDDPRTAAENNQTANILRNILQEMRNSTNGSKVNVTQYVNPLRIKYYQNANQGQDAGFFVSKVIGDLSLTSPVFSNFYKQNILFAKVPENQVNIGNSDFNNIFTYCYVEPGISLQQEFQKRIKNNDNNVIFARPRQSKHNVYGKNIFILLQRFNGEFEYDIPTSLEFEDRLGNKKHYELISAACNRPGHVTACVSTNNGKMAYINDSKVCIYNLEDAKSEFLNGKKSYYATFLNYREV